MNHRLIWSILCVVCLAACSAGEKGLSVTEAWARPGNAGGNSAAYFIIQNPTGEDDTLLSASSQAAKFVELHLSKMDEEGVMAMIQQESIPVPAGEKVELKPGGLHVMLIELAEDLRAGATIALTLQFEKAGTIELQATVRQP